MQEADSTLVRVLSFILQTHVSEPADIKLGEEQQAVDQEPEEKNEIDHVGLLYELCQRVIGRALASQGHSFSRGVGASPAEGKIGGQDGHWWGPYEGGPHPEAQPNLPTCR